MRPGDVAQLVLGCCAFGCVFYAVTHYLDVLRAWDRVMPRLRRRPEERSAARPVQDIAYDVRRLGRRYRHPTPGTRFAKMEGLRRAYDGVLTEAATALAVEHLLGVLPPGPELDRERLRVESALEATGFILEPADTSGR